MESVGEEIPSMFLEIQEALESEEDGVGETMGSKLETLQRYEEQKESKSKTPVDPVKSAEKSWERQLIREALKRAQDLEKPFVRFATEETAQEIQGWGALDGTLGFNEDFAPTTYDFRAIRKRYRKLPQTLSKMGLEAQEVTDQLGNSWVQVDTPPRDQRFVMFSKSNPKNNLGQIGGAVWEQKTQSRTEDLKDLWLVRLQDKYRRVFKLQEDVAAVSKVKSEKAKTLG
jgi:plasmid maintenance system killer protein